MHHEPEVPGAVRQRLDRGLVRDQETGERQDQLGRQRDHRRLDGARDQDPEVAERPVQVGQERDDDLVEEGEHQAAQDGWVTPGRIADYHRPRDRPNRPHRRDADHRRRRGGGPPRRPGEPRSGCPCPRPGGARRDRTARRRGPGGLRRDDRLRRPGEHLDRTGRRGPAPAEPADEPRGGRRARHSRSRSSGRCCCFGPTPWRSATAAAGR